jgi:flavodoxin
VRARYSRTGTTKDVAYTIQESLECDIEEVYDTKIRSGFLGWMRSGRDAGARNHTKIKDVTKDPSSYDVVIVGSPTWNNNVSIPIRTWLHIYRDAIKRAAFFCTQGSERSKTLDEMEKVFGKPPIAYLAFRKKQDIKTGDCHETLKKFVEQIKEHGRS